MTSLKPFVVGAGRVERTARGARLVIGPQAGYSDAQLDDTAQRPRSRFLHRPPLRLTLEARASTSSPPGTLGFGLWNDPFQSVAGEAGARRLLPAMPQAVWFFHASPPSDLPFARGGAGSGWTASSLRGPPLPGLVVAGLGASAALAMSIRPLRPAVLSRYWRTTSASQSAPLAGLDSWHRYAIEWSAEAARFEVDDEIVLEARRPPAGPLGLVLWIDNQWASFSESAGLGFGVLPLVTEAWLDIRDLRLDGDPIEIA